MFLSAQDIKSSPRCTAYMKHDLQPSVFKKANKNVYDAFVRACTDEKAAVKALTWGNDPKVAIAKGGLIKIGGNQMCGMNPPAFSRSNSVFVSDVRTIPLEACVASVDITNNERRFESTLLHEIVHFVRATVGALDPDFGLPNTMEVGDQFEIWAYGSRQCSVDEVADAQSSIF